MADRLDVARSPSKRTLSGQGAEVASVHKRERKRSGPSSGAQEPLLTGGVLSSTVAQTAPMQGVVKKHVGKQNRKAKPADYKLYEEKLNALIVTISTLCLSVARVQAVLKSCIASVAAFKKADLLLNVSMDTTEKYAEACQLLKKTKSDGAALATLPNMDSDSDCE